MVEQLQSTKPIKPVPVAKVDESHSYMRREEVRYAWILLAPALLVTLVVLVYPLLNSFWVSLNEVNIYDRTWTFVGLRNYADVFSDPLFSISIKNSAYFALFTIVGSVGLGLLVGLLLNEAFPGRTICRVIVMIPWSLSQIMVALTFGWIYNSQFGALNGLLYDLGIIQKYVAWLATGEKAMNLLALAYVWKVTPFATLLFLGALQTVPTDLYQAAKADGANVIRRFWHVTLPWIRSTFLVVLIIATLNGFMAFGIIYLLTGGGPGNATNLLSWWGYVVTFRDFNLGKGAAIFYTLSLVMGVLSIFYIRVFLSEGQEGEFRL